MHWYVSNDFFYIAQYPGKKNTFCVPLTFFLVLLKEVQNIVFIPVLYRQLKFCPCLGGTNKNQENSGLWQMVEKCKGFCF